jgi:general secretion pathway protein K
MSKLITNRLFMSSEPASSGYALITTIWFMLLGTAIVSSLMIIALNNAEATLEYEQELTSQLAHESVLETIVADIVFNGPRSSWAALPHQAEYRISGKRFTVSMRSESGKIDINSADTALIDRALQGLAVPAAKRKNLLDQIKKRRSTGRPFRTLAEWNIGEFQESSDRLCFDSDFTIASGLARPVQNHVSRDLARALAVPFANRAHRLQLGAAVTVKIKQGATGSNINYILRISGNPQRPYDILDVSSPINCA